MSKEIKKIVQLLLILALMAHPIVTTLSNEEATIEESDMYQQVEEEGEEIFVYDDIPEEDLPLELEAELPVIDLVSDIKDRYDHVIIEEIDLNEVAVTALSNKLAQMGSYILFDANGMALPMARNQTAVVRERTRLSGTNFNFTNIHPTFLMTLGIPILEASVDGGQTWVTAFCVEVGIVHPNGQTLTEGNPLPANLRATVERILMHGYGNIHGFTAAQRLNNNAYITTQVLIWEAISPEAGGHVRWNFNTPWTGSGAGQMWNALISGNAQREQMYNQIRFDIDNLHRLGTTPNGTSSNPATSPMHTLTWNEANQRYQVNISDTYAAGGHGLLQRFVGNATSGSFGVYHWSRTTATSNVLTIYTTDSNAPQTTSPNNLLSMQPENANAVTYWVHPVLQNVVSGNTTSPLEAFFTVEVAPRGSFELIKVSRPVPSESEVQIVDEENRFGSNPEITVDGADSEGPFLAGVSFELWDTDSDVYVATFVTDEQGRIWAHELSHGNYRLVEVQTDAAHQLAGDAIYFSVDRLTHEHRWVVVNYQTNTSILKVDDLGEPLAGAHFQVREVATNDIVQEWVSTHEAHVILGLTHGEYVLQEVAAPTGFLPGEDVSFTVTDAPETLYLVVENALDGTARIATQAHTGDSEDQYFNAGETVVMHDDIWISHVNIRPDAQLGFTAFLHARLPDGTTETIWESDFTVYAMSAEGEFIVDEPVEMFFTVSTEVETGEFAEGTTFFWSERLYREVSAGEGEMYEWELLYEHNQDGSCQRQTLFPREFVESLPVLPETGAVAGNAAILIGLGLVVLGVVYAQIDKDKFK
ncbi:MAG: SpaA isopeptide-forming pilin-related protein [Turicibacter sp.]|nr:SpaA isopeptide-forming pilin-related protein [Turicibacter sp.]